jgi:hypothetical protein
MQVDHLFVDDIHVDEAEGIATVASTWFEFRETRWVTAHEGTVGQRLGPVTLIEAQETRTYNTPTVATHTFPSRPLRVKGEPGNRSISHIDTWTVEEGALYAIVMPPGFVAMAPELDRKDTDLAAELHLGVTPEGRLFYWALMIGRSPEVFDVKVLMKEDPRKAASLGSNVGVIAEQSRFAGFGTAVKPQQLTPEFLLRLLEFGTSFLR